MIGQTVYAQPSHLEDTLWTTQKQPLGLSSSVHDCLQR